MVVMEENRMKSRCNNNDPWVPLPEQDSAPSPEESSAPSTSQPLVTPAPQNPLNKMIDSERYIQALEKKLAQLSKTKKGEPSSKDIITSLALFHDDQMRRYISETDIFDFDLATCSRNDETWPQMSFVQRKLHPEKQPLSAEEIAELVKEDVLAKVFEETLSSVVSETKTNSLDQQTQSSLVCESAECGPEVYNEISAVNCVRLQEAQDVESKSTSESAEENWANFGEFS